MARYLSLRWPAAPGAQLKAVRLGGAYEAFCPDSIHRLDPLLNSAAATEVVEAEKAVQALQDSAAAVTGLEAFARLLLRGESAASSRIEGLRAGARRIARAAFDDAIHDRTAREVVANIRAMDLAVSQAAAASRFDVDDILDMHRILLADTDLREIAGVERTTQNWIGGNAWNPIGAAYVPPPPERVPSLLDDLVLFCRRTDISPVVQAALAHAQFEIIHPFGDGNGRVGRCLIHVVLTRRGLARHFVPPVSLVLAANVSTYIDGLTAYRDGDIAGWVTLFAQATALAAVEARRFAEDLAAQRRRWLEAAGRPRRGSTTEKVIDALPATPILDIAAVQRAQRVSHEAARVALNRLAAAGVVRELNTSRYRQAWVATEVFDLAETLERRLAATALQTRHVAPAPRPRQLRRDTSPAMRRAR